MPAEATVRGVCAWAYTVPTDAPEADGTAQWDGTTIVVTTADAGGMQGLGYTYADAAVAKLVNGKLAKVLDGCNAMDPPGAWRAMQRAVRNLGRTGLCAMAISAVDVALWDLKAKLLGVPFATLLGRYRDAVPIYGSGGFTSCDDATLARQLGAWVGQDGCRWVKVKIGTTPDRDPARVRAAKDAIGSAALFVDANGALSVKQAQHLSVVFSAEADVRWFEEPVPSGDRGLHRVRAAEPASMEVAAGEYGYEPDYFRRMLATGAVDVPQADATRCGGLQVYCTPHRCARGSIPICRRTAPPHSIGISAAPRRASDTWKGSTTTPASSTCCSTARPCRGMDRSRRIGDGPTWGWSSSSRMPNVSDWGQDDDTEYHGGRDVGAGAGWASDDDAYPRPEATGAADPVASNGAAA